MKTAADSKIQYCEEKTKLTSYPASNGQLVKSITYNYNYCTEM